MNPADKEIHTTCPYCGVGCGLRVKIKESEIPGIVGDRDHPSNLGRVCSKGAALGETIGLEGRLLYPEIDGHRAYWSDALDLVTKKIKEAKDEFGPDSIAFYVSGQLLTEDYYVANKLMKGFIGSGNIDTNSRLCMSSTVSGHCRAFGSDTVPGTYEDLEIADLIVVVGSNLAWCHPVLYQRISAAKEKRPEMKVVLIDPRRTATAELADLHLQIKPDGDVALFVGLFKYLHQNGRNSNRFISAHTNGFNAALDMSSRVDFDEILVLTGLQRQEIDEFYQLFGERSKTVTIFSQGVNQSAVGSDKVNAIINCHLATGRIGVPGSGPFSVTGQPNAMGGREVGGLANMLACHMDIGNPLHRRIVKEFWGSPGLATSAGLKAIDIFNAIDIGKLKAIWIMGTNPVDSLPDSERFERALRKCPFVVVSDIVQNTDTIRHAHVKLPSTGWGEKNGTVTNSERTISRQRPFLLQPGEARPDWWQLTEVAKRLGHKDDFSYSHPSEIFSEFAALSEYKNHGSRDFDIGQYAGISRAEYDQLKPFRWPRPKEKINRKERFFSDGRFYTRNQRANFIPLSIDNAVSTRRSDTFVFNTGRVRDHWHTMTRTSKSIRLSSHISEPYCEIHPDDALRLGIRDAMVVRLENSQGSVLLRALLSEKQRLGSVFAPIHWNDQFAASARVGRLFAQVLDPYSSQPAFKNGLVKVEKWPAKIYGFIICDRKPEQIIAPYWALARCQNGWRIEAAWSQNNEDIVRELYKCLELNSGYQKIFYRDARGCHERYAWFDQEKLKAAIFLSGNPVTASRNWTSESLSRTFNTKTERYRLLAGRAGRDTVDKGAIICSCFSVGVNQIVLAAQTGCKSVEAIGEALNAGTNCGSCRSEIKGILDGQAVIAAE